MPSLIAAALFAAPLLAGSPFAAAPFVAAAPFLDEAAPLTDVVAFDAPAPSVDAFAIDGGFDAERGDGDACVAWAGALILRGCAATDAADPTSSLWPELTAAVELTHRETTVALEVVDRALVVDDDFVARAVVSFTF